MFPNLHGILAQAFGSLFTPGEGVVKGVTEYGPVASGTHVVDSPDGLAVDDMLIALIFQEGGTGPNIVWPSDWFTATALWNNNGEATNAINFDLSVPSPVPATYTFSTDPVPTYIVLVAIDGSQFYSGYNFAWSCLDNTGSSIALSTQAPDNVNSYKYLLLQAAGAARLADSLTLTPPPGFFEIANSGPRSDISGTVFFKEVEKGARVPGPTVVSNGASDTNWGELYIELPLISGPPKPSEIRGYTAYETTVGTTHEIQVPGGVVDGDWLILGVVTRDSTPNIVVPPNFSGGGTFGSIGPYGLYGELFMGFVSGSAPASYTITTDNAPVAMIMVAVDGSRIGTDVAITQNELVTGSSVKHTDGPLFAPSDCLMIRFIGLARGSDDVHILLPDEHYINGRVMNNSSIVMDSYSVKVIGSTDFLTGPTINSQQPDAEWYLVTVELPLS